MIDELTKAWAAGLFDGEGSALIEKTGPDRKSNQIIVSIAGTSAKMSGKVMPLWGGVFRKNRDLSQLNPGTKTTKADHTIYFRDLSQALSFLQDIQPYLIVKYNETEVVIEAIRVVLDFRNTYGQSAHGYSRLLDGHYEKLKTVREACR